MRSNVGRWVAVAGLGIAALGAVPATMGAAVVAWIFLVGGTVLAIAGLLYALLGPTKEERRRSEHERTTTLHALDNETDKLRARLQEIEAELAKFDYWRGVASNYGDNLRVGVIDGEVATLDAEKVSIQRRLSQIETERDLA